MQELAVIHIDHILSVYICDVKLHGAPYDIYDILKLFIIYMSQYSMYRYLRVYKITFEFELLIELLL